MRGRTDGPGVMRVPAAALRDPRATNVAIALASLPGVASVRRAADSAEPVVRGLGWERVPVSVGGCEMHGACVSRMDTPASTLLPSAVTSVVVATGLPSVTMGPGGTGGRVVASLYPAAPPSLASPVAADSMSPATRPRFWADLGWDGARSGVRGGAGVQGATRTLAYRAGLEAASLDDYDTPDGRTVPASHDERAAFGALTWKPRPASTISAALMRVDSDDQDFPSLPMDSELVDLDHASLEWRERLGAGGGLALVVRAGLANVDHVMSNANKPNRTTQVARSVSKADSLTASAALEIPLGATATVTAGIDASTLARDAERTRTMLMNGRVFRDHLWPDARQEQQGAFAEVTYAPATSWEWRVGARGDRLSSEARAADDLGIGGGSVRDGYVRLYGAAAAVTDRDESMLSGNVRVTWRGRPGLQLYAGAGVANRAAGVTERYFAFAPAPGGYTVGNPTLDAESKRELEIGALVDRSRVSLRVSAFAHDVDAFILPTTVDRFDVDGDGRIDRVFGYVNTDARLAGGEVAAVFTVTPRIFVPASVSVVRARDTRRDVPLPEIPPYEANLALRTLLDGRGRHSVEVGARAVDRQSRIDPDFGEDETAGFTVWHVASRIAIGEHLHLDLRLDNLFDCAYNEHLTREVVLPVGGLAAGDEVEEPGRRLSVRLSYSQ